METKNFWLIALAVAVSVAVYPLFLGQFYLVGDMIDVFVPLESFFREELLAGRLPAWNPDIAWGYPVIASAQIGFFYPLLLLLRWLPLNTYFPLILLGHLIFLAFGFYFFLRAEGRSSAAAYFGSIGFTLGSFIMQHLTHLNILLAAAWLPWQFLAIKRLAAAEKVQLNTLALAALAVGLPFLAGQLHLPVLMSIVSLGYFVTLRRRLSWKSSLITIISVSIVAFAVAAAQLLPTAELVLQSSRGPGGDFDIERANQHSFPLYHLPTMLFPRFFGNDDTYWGKRLQIEYGIFIGSIPLVLALYAFFQKKFNSTSKWSLGIGQWAFFHWLLVISFLLALGDLSPFRLIGLEPSLWIFSSPARWVFFTAFSLSYFAAIGFEYFVAASHHAGRALLKLAASVIAICVVATLLLFWAGPNVINVLAPYVTGELPAQYYQEKLAALLASARSTSASLTSPYTALPLIVLTILPFVIRRNHAQRIVLAVTTVELVIIAATTNPTLAWGQAFNAPSTLSALPTSVTSRHARLLTIRPEGDTGLFLTNPDTRADTAQRERYQQLLVPLQHSLFDIAGVEWPASLDLAGHDDILNGIRADASLQQASAANIGAVARQTEQEVQLQELVPAPRTAIANGSVRYESVTPRQTKIIVDVPSREKIIIRDSYYPGWHADVDGRPVPIEKTEKIFRGINVDAGQHVVTMIYEPRLLYIGMFISAIALTAVALLLLRAI